MAVVERHRLPRTYGLRAAAILWSAALTVASVPTPTSAQVVPTNFVDELLVDNLNIPTAFTRLPDGRILIAEKDGLVRVFKNGALLSTPFIDLRSRVNDYWDRGLLGIAADPAFATNGYVYFLYVYENDATDYSGTKTSRLTRVTASGDSAPLSSEVVILGAQVGSSCSNFPVGADCIPADGPGHSVGNIKFASDGTMFVTSGDASSWVVVDEDALRAQSLDSFAGKVLRITTTGQGVPGNPFWTGNANDMRSKIWSYGVRNAFRLDVRPGTSTPYLGDVGWNTWEEINVGRSGANLGWPCYEGGERQPGYEPFSTCQTLYGLGPGAVRAPLAAYAHAGQSASVTGGTFYAGTAFPTEFQDAYFFGDYALTSLSYLHTDINDNLVGTVRQFASGLNGPVYIDTDGTNLLYLAINTGELRRIRHTGAPPPAGVTHVSDVGWTSSNGLGPVERNESNGGQAAGDGVTLRLNGVTFTKGLGAHAPSDIRIALVGSCSSFQATVGVDDEVGSSGSIVFEVWADGAKLYDSGLMTGSTASRAVNVSLTGRSELRLVISDGGNGITSDHGDWADARVTCADNVPPTVIATTPASGATGVPVGSSVAATFSEPMQSSTLTATTVTLLAQGNATPVAATVSYNAITRVVTLDPTSDLAPSTLYTATIRGGGTGAKDVAGNALVSDHVWTFTTAAPGSLTERYLSDVAWTSATNGWGPPELDRSNGESAAGDGTTITLNGVTYANGLGVHASSDIRYALGGTCSTFQAVVGVDDEVGANGSVVFQVWADGIQLYDSGTMLGSTPSALVNVSLSGRNELRLVVTDSGNGNTFDHADWADARLMCTSGSAPATPTFSAPLNLPAGTNTHSVAVVDLNRDGLPDLVAANAGSNNISVFLATAPGAFAPGVQYAVGPAPKSVTAADLTGTGWSDLVTVNQDNGTISVLLSNRDGTFRPAVTYAVSAGAHESAAGDFNGDGRIDLVVVGWGASVANVLLGNGNGTLAAAVTYPVGSTPHSVTIADFDRNGRFDFAVANLGSNDVSVLFGNGNGTFTVGPRLPAGVRPHSIRSGDLNADGNIDLAAVNDGSDDVSVWLGSATGAFAAQTRYSTGSVPKGIAIGDVNGDGHVDVVTAITAGNYPTCCNPGGNTVRLLLGSGTGGLGAPISYTVGTTPFAVAIADLNGDGHRDLATGNWHSNSVTVIFQQAGPADTTPPTVTAVSPVSGATNVAVNASVTATFSEPMDPATLTTTTVTLVRQGTTTPLTATVAYDTPTRTVTLTPASSLLGSTSYTATVKGGSSGAKDAAGNALASDYTWSFTTAASSNTPPMATITTPVSTFTFKVGDVVAFAGSAADAEDGTLPGSRLAWNIDIHHCPGGTCHTHFFLSGAGASGNFTVPDHGDESHFVITLTATDTGGLTDTDTVAIHPQTVPLTLHTSPPGLQVTYNGTATTAPVTYAAIVGGTRTIGTLSPQGGLAFSSWSDGGAQVHNVTVGTTAATYTATFGDTTPPTVTNGTPVAGATGVAINSLVTATFSEAMLASTITSTTMTLTPSGSTTPLAASVTYDATTRVATLDPTADLTPSTTYTATVKGGTSGVKDAAGNALAADHVWSFTTAGGGGSTTSYVSDLTWSSATNGWGPVERDRSNGEAAAADGVPLTLNGVIYAKGVGAHAPSEIRVALGGTCSTFQAAVGVDDEVGANGSVVFEVWGDTTKLYDSGVMTGTTATALVSVALTGRTELRLVITTAADNDMFDHADWADARITCSSSPDTTPPTVTTVSPTAGATGVARNVNVTATFSEPMQAATITTSTVTVIPSGSTTPVPAVVTFNATTRVLTLNPNSNLAANRLYTARIRGGSSGVKDAAGNALASDHVWTFTTQ